MFNYKYVNLKEIIDNVKRGRLYRELPYESAINYGVEAIRLLASEKAEVTQPAKLEIIDYRAKLPANLERIIQTAVVDCNMKYLAAMRYATDNFHSVRHCLNSPDMACSSEYTYSLNNNYIITSFKTGFVFMAYKGLAVDEDCQIIIPDNVNVKLAVQFYIRWRYLDDLGSDDPNIRRQKAEDDQQYCWYIGKAQGAMTDLSMDEYESFANSMSKFFDDSSYHDSFMNGLGVKETIRTQNYG